MKAFSKSYKTLKCNDCGEPVDKVDSHATGVICYKCVLKMTGGHLNKIEETDDKTNELSGATNQELKEE